MLLSWLEIDSKQHCVLYLHQHAVAVTSYPSLSRQGKGFILSEVVADILGPVSLPSALLGVAESGEDAI